MLYCLWQMKILYNMHPERFGLFIDYKKVNTYKMMEIFSKQGKDVKTCRSELVNFIKEQLQAAEGGEGRG